jgi:hypothetical protein
MTTAFKDLRVGKDTWKKSQAFDSSHIYSFESRCKSPTRAMTENLALEKGELIWNINSFNDNMKQNQPVKYGTLNIPINLKF